MDDPEVEQFMKEINKRRIEIDRQIDDLEDIYLERTQVYGNVIIGWQGYLDTKTPRIIMQPASLRRDKKMIRPKDKIFSGSAVPASAGAAPHHHHHHNQYQRTYTNTRIDSSPSASSMIMPVTSASSLIGTTARTRRKRPLPSVSTTNETEDLDDQVEENLDEHNNNEGVVEISGSVNGDEANANDDDADDAQANASEVPNPKPTRTRKREIDDLSIPSNRSSTPALLDPRGTSGNPMKRRRQRSTRSATAGSTE